MKWYGMVMKFLLKLGNFWAMEKNFFRKFFDFFEILRKYSKKSKNIQNDSKRYRIFYFLYRTVDQSTLKFCRCLQISELPNANFIVNNYPTAKLKSYMESQISANYMVLTKNINIGWKWPSYSILKTKIPRFFPHSV